MTGIASDHKAAATKLLDAMQSHLRAQYRGRMALPNTRLGVALDAVNTSATDLVSAVVLVTSYTTVVQTISPPQLQLQTDPEGPGVSPVVYDQYEDQFLPIWAQFESIVSHWMLPGQPNTGFSSQMASVPAILENMNQLVTSDLQAMLNNPVGSDAYNSAKSNVTGYIQSQITELQGISAQLTQYSNDLQAATTSVVNQADTGALADAISAYQTEIDDLNSQLSSLNWELVGDYIALVEEYGDAAIFGVVMLVGRVGVHVPGFPIKVVSGGIAIFGAVFYALSTYAIASTKLDIAQTQAEIEKISSSLDADSNSLTSLGVVVDQIDGLVGVEAQAVQALNTLIDALGALGDELDDIVADANKNDPSDALSEWDMLTDAAAALAAQQTYHWPAGTAVFDCKTVAPTTTGVVALDIDGKIYRADGGERPWVALPGTAVSVAASDIETVIIQGEPVCPTDPVGTGNDSYLPARYNGTGWDVIGNDPVSNVAVYGSNIFAIKNAADSGMDVVQYAGNGTDWTSLGLPDTSDPPGSLTAYDGGVIVTTQSKGLCYVWDGTAWRQVTGPDAMLVTVEASGSRASATDSQHNAYLLDPATLTMSATTAGGYTSALQGAGIQYLVSGDGTLSSLDTANSSASPQSIAGQMASVFCDATGQSVYCVTVPGQINQVTGQGSDAVLTALPELPSATG